MSEYEEVYNYIDSHFEKHIKATQELLRQPDFSHSGLYPDPDVVKCGEMLVRTIRGLGGESHLVEFGDGNPVVYGELRSKNPNAKTIIVYSLYDVLPVDDDEEWTTPPFAAEIVDAELIGLPHDYGKCIVAKGAVNRKGPLMGFINAVEAMLSVNGDLPLNIIFTLDGEEEIGSPHFPEFRDRYLDNLKEAESVYYTSPYQDGEGRHHVFLGAKGLIMLELITEGGDWGGPKQRHLFSIDDVWVDPPAWRLVGALNTLKNQEGKVLIQGFYDNVRSITARERELIENLKDIFDEEKEKKRLGITRWRKGLQGKEFLGDYIMSPLVNICGLVSGHIGPRVKTMLPSRAVAKMDIRLVPDMDKEDVLQKLRGHLDRHGFSDVQINTLSAYNWVKTSPDADIVKAAIAGAKMFGVDSYVWPNYFASVPTAAFSEPPLGLPMVGGGLGRMGRPHQADEFCTLEGLRSYEKFVVTFLNEYARL